VQPIVEKIGRLGKSGTLADKAPRPILFFRRQTVQSSSTRSPALHGPAAAYTRVIRGDFRKATAPRRQSSSSSISSTFPRKEEEREEAAK